MKTKNNFSILFLLLLALNISAQTTFNLEDIKDFLKSETKSIQVFKVPIKSASEDIFVLDSVLSTSYYRQTEETIYFNHYYKYDNNGNVIESKRLTNCITCQIGGNEKRMFTFNEKRNKTSEIYFELDLNSNEWIPVSKLEIIFGMNDEVVEKFFYRYATTTQEWMQSSKTANTYDGNGILISEIGYNWSEKVNSWQYSSKMEQSFNEDGYLLKRENYVYDLDNSIWIGTVKEENILENGLIIIGIRYEWDYELNQWRNEVKGEYTYDANGYKTMESGYSWNANDEIWENFYKYEFSINASGQTDSLVTFTTDSGKQWIGAYKEVYSYDKNGNITLLVNSEWDKNTSDWMYHHKIGTEFNANNNLISEIIYSWNNTQNDWIYASKRTFDFDINGNIKTDNTYNWDINNNNWWLSHTSECFYSALATNINKYFAKFLNIKVYPNPTNKGIVYFEDLDFETLELFDLHGKCIKEENISGFNLFELNVSELLPGIYFYLLQTKGLAETKGKLIVQ